MTHATAKSDADARAKRTSQQLFAAFTQLVLTQRYDEISVADIVRTAGVARSTFYQHFTNKDDLLITSMGPMLNVIARAVSGSRDPGELQVVLGHFWDNRSLGRIVLKGRPYDLIVAALAQLVENELSDSSNDDQGVPGSLQAIGIASATMAQLRSWITGKVACDVGALAGHLSRGSHGC